MVITLVITADINQAESSKFSTEGFHHHHHHHNHHLVAFIRCVVIKSKQIKPES
jgi:hypothetical protein